METKQNAKEIVNTHVVWAFGGGLIPLPLIDFSAVTAIQVDMLSQLSKLYEVEYSDDVGKKIVVALTGTTFAKLAASFVKIIPGIGPILGGLSMSVLSGASTYAVGQVAIEHFESGGTLFNVDLISIQEKYQSAFEKGKEFAEKLRADTLPTSTQESLGAIEKLGELRDKKLISDEEFQSKKEELLKRV